MTKIEKYTNRQTDNYALLETSGRKGREDDGYGYT